jgi:hypothetical protein
MNTLIATPLARAYSTYEDKIGGQLKPDSRFYTKVGINRKRFGQLLRGEKPLNAPEITALAQFFGIQPNDLL